MAQAIDCEAANSNKSCAFFADSHASVKSQSKDLIRPNDLVLIKMPAKALFLLRVEANKQLSIGKLGIVSADELIGTPFGLLYKFIGENRITQADPEEILLIENEDSNNRLLNDNPTNQRLTSEMVEEIKDQLKQHVDYGRLLTEKLIENNKDFEIKNAYSKQKYIKRKIDKYGKRFQIVRPTLVSLCDYYLARNASKTLYMSSDALSFMIQMAGVRVGGRYLCIDDTSGLLLGAMLQRMNLEGTITCIHQTEHPSLDCLLPWNLGKTAAQLIQDGTLKFLNWLTAVHPNDALAAAQYVYNIATHNASKATTQSSNMRLAKKLDIFESFKSRLADFEVGDYDALIIASDLDISKALPLLLGKCGNSMPIIVYGIAKEYLTPIAFYMQRLDANVLAPTLHEVRHREYQTFSGRTRPLLVMRGDNSFILTGTKIIRDQDVNAAGKQYFKKRKAKVT